MKDLLIMVLLTLPLVSCNNSPDKEALRQEILLTEKAFEKMCAEKGIAEAFYHYADTSAVILRQQDSIILGKDRIRKYYEERSNQQATVTWTPDFIEVSDCGTLGYTYGRYVWKIMGADSTVSEYKGIFHTVWKKQSDKSWKYVWD